MSTVREENYALESPPGAKLNDDTTFHFICGTPSEKGREKLG